MLCALWFSLEKPVEIVMSNFRENVVKLTSDSGSRDVAPAPGEKEPANQLLAVLRRHFLPNAVMLLSEDAQLVRADEHRVEMPGIDSQPTVYVCENFACQLPVTAVNELEALLE